ncbi:MAG TPA: glycosyl hydrolase family 32 [Arthrobacter bacterium]|nr:glycosyl hydrolase family 32 [Arthrobacter sp.]
MSNLPVRPEFHLTPNKGWINDPLALTYKDGQYHLFYQYVPDSTVWAPNCHWGHSTSPDLASWTEHGVAVAPGEGDDGIWSGSIAVDGDQATMFYTAVSVPDLGIGRVRVATPDDSSWDRWTKGDVVVTAPEELDLIGFRDPFVFKDGDSWRMLVGTGLAGGVAAASSFSSTDLRTWTFDGLAAQRPGSETEPVWSGTLWECPQIFEIDGRHLLVTSVWENDVLHYVAYAVGDYTDGKFTASTWGRLTYGNSYYAPSFFRDKDDRPGLIFWMRGVLDETNGRASALSVPHTLSLDGDRLVSQPHPDLLAYATPARPSAEPFSLPPNTAHLIEWAADIGTTLTVSQQNGISITMEATLEALTIDDGNSTTAMPVGRGGVTVLLDGPTAEIFTETGVFGIGVAAGGGEIVINGAGAVRSLIR